MKYREDDLQMATARYLDYQGLLWCHVANERKTTKMAGSRLKRKGVKSGVPDILIFTKNKNGSSTAIELKIKPNKPNENQKKWLKDLSNHGFDCYVCYDMDEVIKIIEKNYNGL